MAYREQSTGKIEKVPAKLVENIDVASPENWQVAIDGMLKVTHGGTGSRVQVGAEYEIAGKTGTAQVFTIAQGEKYNEKQLNERLHDHGWFVAFAPADNPKIVVAALIENGKHGIAAGHIARRVLDQFILGHTTTPEIPPPVIAPSGEVLPPVAAGDE
jgi:penicillin-binding protein 2